MHDIQKANALGDSPDFPIIKVSVFHFYRIYDDDKFYLIGCRSETTTDNGYFCCIFEKIKNRSNLSQ